MILGQTSRSIAAFLAVFFFLAGGSLLGQPNKPKVEILNSAQIYYPSIVKKSSKYKKPAILTTATVFDSIPEWKKIKKKKLKKSDAEYHLLLEKANEKFNKALSKVQGASSYDIMAEVGAIKCTNCTPTDVTSELIANLPS